MFHLGTTVEIDCRPRVVHSLQKRPNRFADAASRVDRSERVTFQFHLCKPMHVLLRRRANTLSAPVGLGLVVLLLSL